jgi:hypothetical protein
MITIRNSTPKTYITNASCDAPYSHAILTDEADLVMLGGSAHDLSGNRNQTKWYVLKSHSHLGTFLSTAFQSMGLCLDGNVPFEHLGHSV